MEDAFDNLKSSHAKEKEIFDEQSDELEVLQLSNEQIKSELADSKVRLSISNLKLDKMELQFKKAEKLKRNDRCKVS